MEINCFALRIHFELIIQPAIIVLCDYLTQSLISHIANPERPPISPSSDTFIQSNIYQSCSISELAFKSIELDTWLWDNQSLFVNLEPKFSCKHFKQDDLFQYSINTLNPCRRVFTNIERPATKYHLLAGNADPSDAAIKRSGLWNVGKGLPVYAGL